MVVQHVTFFLLLFAINRINLSDLYLLTISFLDDDKCSHSILSEGLRVCLLFLYQFSIKFWICVQINVALKLSLRVWSRFPFHLMDITGKYVSSRAFSDTSTFMHCIPTRSCFFLLITTLYTSVIFFSSCYRVNYLI